MPDMSELVDNTIVLNAPTQIKHEDTQPLVEDSNLNTAIVQIAPSSEQTLVLEPQVEERLRYHLIHKKNMMETPSMTVSSVELQQTAEQNETKPGLLPKDFKSQLQQHIAAWEQLYQREQLLLDQAKLYLNNFNLTCENVEMQRTFFQHYDYLGQEIASFMDQKNVVLQGIVVSSSRAGSRFQPSVLSVPMPPQQPLVEQEQPFIKITQQPGDVAIANRYLMPAPTIVIPPNYVPSEPNATLIVSATLCYYSTDKEVTRATDAKQDVLQGIKKVAVDKSRIATFNKLKVTEVSSKHKHKAFCLLFTLEEYVHGNRRVIANCKSSSFHVQSRPNNNNTTKKSKRKREDEPYELPSKSQKEAEDSDCSSPNSPQPSPQSTESTFVDITDLLTLPQKEAASRLGISESMLCKRFKECTRRKWPYRYLRKIDKIINILSLHQAGGVIPKEDKDKLDRLMKEREECLQPVKIRITAHDKLSDRDILDSSDSVDEAPTPSSSNALNDEDQFVLETLEMLKAHPLS